MTVSKGIAFAALALSALGAPLRAEIVLNDTQYGLSAAGVAPLQDLRDVTGKSGYQLGLFAENKLNPTTYLQTRLDFTRFPETRDLARSRPVKFLPTGALTLSANATALSVDVRHLLPYRGLRDVFLIAGVSLIRYEFSSTAPGTAVDQNGIPIPGLIQAKVKTSLKLAGVVGAGYQLSPHWTASARYTLMPIDGALLATLAVGAGVRF